MSQTFQLAFDSGSLHTVRAAVQTQAAQAGMPEDQAIDVVLVIHELAANAVRHGAGTGRLRMWSQPGELWCEVEDAGQAAHTGEATGPGRAVKTDPWPYLDGHGLWVVRKVADRLAVNSGPGGTRACVTFKLSPPSD
jgi:anti-sigma regulatory factor (Ser/Thr protein kinase)